MGGLCQPKPQVTATNQTQTYTPAPQIGAAGTQALNMAQGAAQQPFQMPAAPVAGFNPFQTQSFNQILGMQGSLNNTAGANLQTAQAPITQDDINQNMNPYADQTEADIKKYIFDPQRVQTMGQSTAMAGGVGADRLGLVSGNLDKTQGDILAQARSGFYGQALSAAQQAKQQALQSAQGWQNLQTGNLQATNALGMVGTQQQQQTQAELMSPYQQILAQIAYPYQQAQFLAGITGGLAGAMGGTTTGVGNTSTTPAQPSIFNQAVGLGAAGVGAYGALSGSGSGATSTPNSPNASMYTGDPSQAGFGPTYYRSGGPVHYASGGSDDEEPSLSPYGDLNPIPRIPLHMTSGQSHNNLNLNPPSQSGGSSSSGGIGDIAKMASAVIPFFLKRGGTVADGGSVNPWDIGRGYATDGAVDVDEYSPDDFNPIDAASALRDEGLRREETTRSPYISDYVAPLAPRSSPGAANAATYPPGNPFGDPAAKLREAGLQQEATIRAEHAARPSLAEHEAATPGPFDTAALQGPYRWSDMKPPVGPPSQSPEPPPPPGPTQVAAVPQPRMLPPRQAIPPSPDRTGGYPPTQTAGLNSDMSVGNMQMPRSQQPYPDALGRDWGQKATRSPWMALVQAGLKMAQSTKPGVAGLAEGAESGVKYLGDQRKELRSEEQINQKSEELFRHAQTELNKYTRKTPHEVATEQETARYHTILGGLGQGRLDAQLQAGNISYAGPVKDEPGMGYFYDKKHLDASGNPAIFKAPFNVGEKPGTAGRDSPRIAAYNRYLKDFPEDPQGAQDILRGHKTISESDVRRRVEATVTNAMKAQGIQPGTDEWIQEFNRRVNENMAQAKTDYGIK